MKRDMDLIRELMLKLETLPVASVGLPVTDKEGRRPSA